MPNIWLVVIIAVLVGILVVPAVPYLLMGVGLYVIVRKLVRILAYIGNSGRADTQRPSGD